MLLLGATALVVEHAEGLRMGSVSAKTTAQNVSFRVILVSIDQLHIFINNLFNSSGAAHRYVQHIRLHPLCVCSELSAEAMFKERSLVSASALDYV